MYAAGCSEDVENKVLCKYTLKEHDLTQLRDAIEDLYYFEFVIGKFACFLLIFAVMTCISHTQLGSG